MFGVATGVPFAILAAGAIPLVPLSATFTAAGPLIELSEFAGAVTIGLKP